MLFGSHWIPKSLFAAALLGVTWLSLRPKTVAEAALSEESTRSPQFVFEVIEHMPHFTAYTVLLVIGALIIQRRRNLLILGVALVSLGFIFEVIQNWVPNRSPSVEDMIANVFGVIFSITVLPKFAKWFRKPT